MANDILLTCLLIYTLRNRITIGFQVSKAGLVIHKKSNYK